MAVHQESTYKNTSRKILMKIAVWLPLVFDVLNERQNLLLLKPIPDVGNFKISA